MSVWETWKYRLKKSCLFQSINSVNNKFVVWPVHTAAYVSPSALMHRYNPVFTPLIPTTPCFIAKTFIQPGRRQRTKCVYCLFSHENKQSSCWTQLTVLVGLVDASHRTIGQYLEVVANPSAAVEQLLWESFSDWLRVRTCWTKHYRSKHCLFVVFSNVKRHWQKILQVVCVFRQLKTTNHISPLIKYWRLTGPRSR